MGILAPILSGRLRARRPVLIGLALLFLVGIAGLLLAPLAAPWLWGCSSAPGTTGSSPSAWYCRLTWPGGRMWAPSPA
jgi:cyanate permease